MVVTGETPPDAARSKRAARRCRRSTASASRSRALLARRTDKDRTTQTGELLTDDFAPVNLYDTIGERGTAARKK